MSNINTALTLKFVKSLGIWIVRIPATQAVSENVVDPRNMNYMDLQVVMSFS